MLPYETEVPAHLRAAMERCDRVLHALHPQIRLEVQAKGPMYLLGDRRVCGVRPAARHVRLLLFGLKDCDPHVAGLLVSRPQNYDVANVRDYEDVQRLHPAFIAAVRSVGDAVGP